MRRPPPAQPPDDATNDATARPRRSRGAALQLQYHYRPRAVTAGREKQPQPLPRRQRRRGVGGGGGSSASAPVSPIARGGGEEDEGGPARRKTVRWSRVEVNALLEGVRKEGVGKWAAILRGSDVFVERRTSIDLKDKWRNVKKEVRDRVLRDVKAAEEAEAEAEGRGSGEEAALEALEEAAAADAEEEEPEDLRWEPSTTFAPPDAFGSAVSTSSDPGPPPPPQELEQEQQQEQQPQAYEAYLPETWTRMAPARVPRPMAPVVPTLGAFDGGWEAGVEVMKAEPGLQPVKMDAQMEIAESGAGGMVGMTGDGVLDMPQGQADSRMFGGDVEGMPPPPGELPCGGGFGDAAQAAVDDTVAGDAFEYHEAWGFDSGFRMLRMARRAGDGD